MKTRGAMGQTGRASSVQYTPLLVRSVSCLCCLPVGRPTLTRRLLVRSHGGRGADALGFRRNSTSSEATGRHWQQPVPSRALAIMALGGALGRGTASLCRCMLS